MNTRIEQTFARLQKNGRKALIPYVTGGFPRRTDTVPTLRAMAAAGADIIEIGVPFSDPMADGPVIQQANDVALAQGVSLRDVLAMVAEFRTHDVATPVILMGYANPIERFGLEAFVPAARAAGVDGLIVVDLPPEEATDLQRAARAAGIDIIFLLAPTSTAARIARVRELAGGYAYYVSLNGVTGGRLDPDEVVGRVRSLKAELPLPVCVGFGIRDAATARTIGAAADGVIIGTRMIQVLQDGPPDGAAERAATFIAGIRQALDAPGATT